MGLDASVYCDCWEKGKLNSPAPNPEFVTMDESGFLEIESDDDQLYFAFEEWKSSACEHPSMKLVHRRLGNISHIAVLRDIVSQLSSDPKEEFPVTWNKVIYSGSHGGDFLRVDEVRKLKDEIDVLRQKELSNVKTPRDKQGKRPMFALLPGGLEPPAGKETYEWCWSTFLESMDLLIQASLSINKPLVF